MNSKQLLYHGPPGTGKTYGAREAAIRIVNPNVNNELESVNKAADDNDDVSFEKINKAFEIFFEYDSSINKSKSKFLHDREFKPGKTCYRNMSALNKFMSTMIDKGVNSITRDEWPLQGSSTFAQYSRAATNFDLATESRPEGNKIEVSLNEEGVKIKEQYESLKILKPELDLYKLRELPEFSRETIINSLKNTDESNMSMWKSTIIGSLWFIVRNGYIFKYRTPDNINITEKEKELLKVCLGYESEDNTFLSWITPYLMDLGLVVGSDSQNERYLSEYYLSTEGKKLLRNMKIVKDNSDNVNITDYENDSKDVAASDEKIYILKDNFIHERSKLKEIFSRYRDNEENNIDMITLHPSFEYENFIEGISVKTMDKGLSYYNKSGILKDICYKALRNLIKSNLIELVKENEIGENQSKKILNSITDWKSCYLKYRELESQLSWDFCDNFVLIIDEINRGDIAKVFGEVITLLEIDKRLGAHNEQVVKLPFTNDVFSIPKNIFIIATMNTSDRSIANMDIALRRRFGFIKCKPDLDLVNELYIFVPSESDNVNLLEQSVEALKYINKKLSKISFIGPDKLIGHSYLMGLDVFKDRDIVNIWVQNIIPLLEEYFLGEYEIIIDVIPKQFVDEETGTIVYEDEEDILTLIEEMSIKNED